MQALKLLQLYQTTKKIRPSKKVLINIQNSNNNECFKWHFIRYLHSADHISGRIRKVANDFTKNLDFKEIKSLPKLEIILSASVFLDMKA